MMPGQWDGPGRQADPTRWNLDLKKGWVPPGQKADLKSTQYTMPHGFDPGSVPNWHLLASPPGTPAPRDAINYTPDMGVSPVGVQAPTDRMNLSMLPAGRPAPTGSSPPVGAGQAEGDDLSSYGQYDDGGASGTAPGGGFDPSSVVPREAPSPSNPAPAAPSAPSPAGRTTTRTTETSGGNLLAPQTSTTTTTTTDPTKITTRVVRVNGKEILIATDAEGNIVSQTDLGAAGTTKNTTRAIKVGNGYRLVTFNSDGNIVNDQPVEGSGTSGGTRSAPRNNTRQYTVQGQDGTPHRMEEVTDPQGNVVTTRDLGQTTSGAQSRVREYTVIQQDGAPHRMRDELDSSGQVISTSDLGVAPGGRPTATLNPGQTLVNPSTGATIASQPAAPNYQTVGNQLFDMNTGQPTTGVNTSRTLQQMESASGARDLYGIDPYTGETSQIAHTPGEPRDMAHNIYLPGEWSGDYPTFDPAHPSQPTQGHHQGTPWTPPAGMHQGGWAPRPPSQAPSGGAPAPAPAPAPQPQPQAAAPAPVADTLPPPSTPEQFWADPGVQNSSRHGLDLYGESLVPKPGPPPVDIAPPPDPGMMAGGSRGTGGEAAGGPPPVDTSGFDQPEIGEGQDNPQPQTGGPWKPPIDPSQVVGTGHKFGEQVSIEGTHKGVDLQAYRGTPAKSPVDGTVVRVEHNPKGLGITVTVRDVQGHEHTLGHLGSVSVKPGDTVRAGQPVATVGSTGASTGPHLDVREKGPNGQPVDPTPKLGPLAQMPRADNGQEPQPEGGDPAAMGMGQDMWRPSVGMGQDVGVGGQYTVPLEGGGFMTVNASSPQAAMENAHQGGNTPTGSPIAGGHMAHEDNGNAVAGSGPGNPGDPSVNPNAMGGGGGGGGGGGSGSIVPNWYDQAYIQYLNDNMKTQAGTAAAQLENARQAEINRHNEALTSLKTAQDAQAENARHDQALEQIQMQTAQLQSDTSKAIAMLQARSQEGIVAAQIAAQYGLQSMQFRQQVATSALQNPWLKRLSGMTPGYGEVGGPGGDGWNPPTGQNLQTSLNSAAGVPNGGRVLQAQGAPQTQSTPDIAANDFMNWSPFQLAAWRTSTEAQGPGAFANAQDSLLSSWGKQGITAPTDSTQLSWDASGPMGQTQKSMQAEFFGKDPQAWLGGQQKNWAGAKQAQVSLA